jgi:hypothetical protein
MFWDFVEAICRVADVVSFHDEEWLNTYFSKEHVGAITRVGK